MEILLLNPNNIRSKNDAMMCDFVGRVPPYGLLSMAGLLRDNGYNVTVIDQYVQHKTEDELINAILEGKPDVLGISVLAPTFSWVKRLCFHVKKALPKTRIILGNSFASIFHKEILSEGVADAVVHGEGELTLVDYVKSLHSQADMRTIRGISYIENGEIIKNEPRELIGDLDSLPYPAWDCIDFNKYDKIPMLSLYGPVFLIQGSRGCTFNCFYCSQDASFKIFRKRNVRAIVDEIEHLHVKYNATNFIFLDAYFPSSIKSGMEFSDELISRGLNKKIRWITETKVDLVNSELLSKMKEAGLYLIMYGFETGSDRILKMINKHTSLDKARQVMRDTHKIGIRTLGLFMLGFPDETEQECRQTIRFSKELDCDLVKYNLLTPYPGTSLFDLYVKDKMAAYRNPELFSSWYMIANKGREAFNFSKVDSGSLLNIQRKALLSYYIRPKIIYNFVIRRIVRFDTILKAIYFLALNYVLMLRKQKHVPASVKPKSDL